MEMVNKLEWVFVVCAGPSGRSPAEIMGSNPTGGMDVCLLWVLCCQVEVSATSCSLIQRSPIDCGASLCVILEPREWEGHDPLGAVAPKTNNLRCVQSGVRVYVWVRLVLPVPPPSFYGRTSWPHKPVHLPTTWALRESDTFLHVRWHNHDHLWTCTNCHHNIKPQFFCLAVSHLCLLFLIPLMTLIDVLLNTI
jgi:hypothetical protein